MFGQHLLVIIYTKLIFKKLLKLKFVIGGSFLSLTAHYIDKKSWAPVQLTLGLVDLGNSSHTGIRNIVYCNCFNSNFYCCMATGDVLAEKIVQILNSYGSKVLNSVFTITCDNASNNKSMCKKIDELVKQRNAECTKFRADEGQLPCFNHIINLVSHNFLKCLKSAPTENSNSSNDTSIINKLRDGLKRIKHHSNLKVAFEEYCQRYNMPKLAPIIDCPTRWNSSHAMIKRFLKVKNAYNYAINLDEYARENYYLNPEEIKFLASVEKLLLRFYVATNWLSTQR